jgi:hypothetical protein
MYGLSLLHNNLVCELEGGAHYGFVGTLQYLNLLLSSINSYTLSNNNMLSLSFKLLLWGLEPMFGLH